MPKGSGGRRLHLKRYLLAGLLTLVPLWVTWTVLVFVYRSLSRVGAPLARSLAAALEDDLTPVARILRAAWFQDLLGAVLVLVLLYVLGWLASRVAGRRVIRALEAMVLRIPVVQQVYGLVKKLLESFDRKPEDVQRVVLIEFPSEQMKTVGLVTRTLVDEVTGRKLAAVYVPTTPNPTSGYLEIVPVERMVETDWTIDEAMSFIVSGGAVAPARFRFSNPPTEADGEP